MTLTVIAVSENPLLIPDPTVSYTSPNATGMLTFTPVANLFGTATVTVTVTDDGGTTGGGVNTFSRTFLVTVKSVNDAPTLDGLANLTIDQNSGEQTVNLAGISAGPGEPAQFINLLVASDNPALIPTPTFQYSSPNPTGTIRFTPAPGQTGTATITVTLVDDGGTANGGVDTVQRTFTVTVRPPNQAPTLGAIGDLTMNEDAGEQTVNLTGISAGAGETGQLISIVAVSSNPGLIPNPTVEYTSPNAAGALRFTPAADQSGTATITVTVTDDGGTANGGVNTVQQSFTITVNSANDAPTLDAIADLDVLEDAPEQTVNLSGISSGAANESGQTLTVTAVSNNPALVPNPTVVYTPGAATGILKFTPVANQVGTATVTVTVSDDGGTANGGVATFTRTFTVTVESVNDAPTLDQPDPVTIAEDAGEQTVALTGIAAGPANEGGQSLSVTASSDNTGLIPNPTVTYTAPNATGTLRFTPVPNAFGTATVTVTVTDGGGTANGGVNSVVRTFTVTVNPVNDLPVVSGGPFAILQSVANGAAVGTVAATDVEDNTPFAFAIAGGNTGGAFVIDALSGEITVANGAEIDDFYLLTVTATDSGGAVGTGTVQVNVDRRPTTSGIANQTKPEDSGAFDLDLAAAFNDVETPDPDLTFAVVANSNPALFSGVNVAGTTLTLTPAADANGVATLTVRATDSVGQTVETSFQVTLGPVNDGPVLNAAARVALTAVAAKAANPAGDPVTVLTANVTDVDVETPGVAITGFTQGANGAWQFSTDNGANWQPVPTDVAVDNALLLDESTKVRFLPSKKFQGFAFLSYKAWDQSTGTAGTQADATTGSAFSAAVETAVVAVGKTTPRIDAAGFPLLSNVAEGTAAPK
ncbi:MAG TPA: Ig-like domain-containing protein, partial [Gemmataceae bacterium]|nr:Ig-like domain-containing protein [Gemmataceae bacterium]